MDVLPEVPRASPSAAADTESVAADGARGARAGEGVTAALDSALEGLTELPVATDPVPDEAVVVEGNWVPGLLSCPTTVEGAGGKDADCVLPSTGVEPPELVGAAVLELPLQFQFHVQVQFQLGASGPPVISEMLCEASPQFQFHVHFQIQTESAGGLGASC